MQTNNKIRIAPDDRLVATVTRGWIGPLRSAVIVNTSYALNDNPWLNGVQASKRNAHWLSFFKLADTTPLSRIGSMSIAQPGSTPKTTTEQSFCSHTACTGSIASLSFQLLDVIFGQKLLLPVKRLPQNPGTLVVLGH